MRRSEQPFAQLVAAAALALALAAMPACGGGKGGSAASASDPVPYPNVGPNGELRGESNFAKLISLHSKGQVANHPWAGYWWPYLQNGTASADSLYEQAHGASGAVDWELAHHGAGLDNIQDWWGHCNGWAAAAVLFPEPRDVKAVAGVQFGIADRKALLSEIAMEVQADFFGTRVDDPNDTSSLAFQDVFPDQYFLVLTNIVGNGMPLVIDRYTGNQVWNQPMAGYTIDPITPDAYFGTDPSAPNVHRVMVTTTIWWLSDNVDGDHLTEPFAFSDGPSYESRTLSFEVWLDGPPIFDASGNLTSSGNVILTRQGNFVTGGVWHIGNDLAITNSYPDYMWIPHQVSSSTGYSNPHVDAAWVQANM